MKNRANVLLLMACLFLGTGLASQAAAQELSEPEKVFEHLWKTYDRNYALFGPKRIDWDALYKVYRPRVTAQTTEDELFDILASLVGNLNDNHVRLNSAKRAFQSGILGQMKMEDFSLDLVKQTYLKGRVKELASGLFQYGWLDDSIGYFHFNGFRGMEESAAAVDQIIQEFKDAKALVVDVRGNGGGDDRVGKLIADRFADRKRLYMMTRIRNGPAHDDFTAWKYWYVEPDGPIQFTRPVILLIHRFSVSAAENFTLAMRVLPGVTVVGDATSGVFADVYGDRLPNGWRFSVPFKLFVDWRGFCWEGIGVPADIRQINTKQDVEQKRDKPLELAAALISTSALKPHDPNAGASDVRESLARSLGKNVADHGVEAAVAAFNKSKAGKPQSYYIDQEEMAFLGDRLWRSGKKREAIEVFKLNAREFPGYYQVHERLGDAYLSTGDEAQALRCFKKSAEVNRRSYPWEAQSYEDASHIAAGVKPLARMLAADIDEKGIEVALKAFERGKAAGPGAYYVAENDMNSLGYRLMARGKLKEAVEVFKLNVGEFPASANVYDSLGEAYMRAGDKALAISNYKKSLELNPHNDGAVDALKKLEGAPVEPSAGLYDTYAGEYDSPLGPLVITREEDKLFGAPPGQSKHELIPVTDTRFSVPAAGAEVVFVKDDAGQVSHMLIRMGGQEMKAKKVK